MEVFLNNIIVIILATFTLSFAIAYMSVLHRMSKLTQEFSKLFISHKSLQDFVEKNNFEFKNDNDVHKENFIKFLYFVSVLQSLGSRLKLRQRIIATSFVYFKRFYLQ